MVIITFDAKTISDI